MLASTLENFFKGILVIFLFFMGTKSANSAVSYDKYWTVAVITGSLSKHSSFNYYFEPQLRLIDDTYVFNQLLLLGGLGYQLNTKVAFYLGPGLILSKTPQGIQHQEKRFWQQLNWLVLNTPQLNLNSRTRLEERQRSDVAQMAIRLRERIWLRIPFKRWENYSFSCFNEIFFNLNYPQWASPYFLEQNRAFVGIATQLSKSTLIDVGYLNQYLHLAKKQLDHVLLLSFTVNW